MAVAKNPVTGELVYSEPRTVLDQIKCPSCGHYAAYKLDACGVITYDDAVSYCCALLWCSHKFGEATA